MRFSKDTQVRANLASDASTLAEVLPWIKEATGKTVVIKYGGAAMEDPALCAQVMSDIVLLKVIGVRPVIVHGGGKAINRAFSTYGIPVEFVNGMRVTTPEAMDVVRMVLVGQVNQNLVRDINEHGNLAVGLSGNDGGIIVAEQLDPDLGRVGHITKINPELIEAVLDDDYIPIIASVALGEDGGYYNINADIAAAAIAAAIGAHKFVALTDVDGLYLDFPNKESLISQITRDEAQGLIDRGVLESGMIPKIESCVNVIDAGVPRAHIINGKVPHALLLEILTDTGIGTMIMGPDQGIPEAESLSNFASKLLNNH